MPYRNQATVAAWVRDYLEDRRMEPSFVSVLDKEFTPGPESGLVVVALSNASTVTYIQPIVSEGQARWMVTFEPRTEGFDLDAVGVARLSADLSSLADLCGYLQERTEQAIVDAPTAAV